MEGAGAIKCCGMIQAYGFGVVSLSLLEKAGLENNGESIVYSDNLDWPTWSKLYDDIFAFSEQASQHKPELKERDKSGTRKKTNIVSWLF